MEEPLYTVEEAASELGLSDSRIYQMAINNDIRMGVYARDWWGVWYPKRPGDSLLENTDAGVCDIDKDGIRIYSHNMADGTVIKLQEFYIYHFWFIEYSELYKLLTGRGREAREISWFIPTEGGKKELLEAENQLITEAGVFWATKKHRGKKQNLTISVEDLLIPLSELRSVHLPKKDKQKQREEALEELKEQCGIDNLVILGRQGVWKKLQEKDPHLFSAASLSTITKFYEQQKIIAFR